MLNFNNIPVNILCIHKCQLSGVRNRCFDNIANLCSAICQKPCQNLVHVVHFERNVSKAFSVDSGFSIFSDGVGLKNLKRGQMIFIAG